MSAQAAWWLVAGAVLVVAAVIALAAVLVRRMTTRFVVPRPYALMAEFEVLAVQGAPDAITVTLPAPGPNAPQHAQTRASGTYGLVWEGGHGLLGDVIADDGARIERSLTVIEGAPPRRGGAARTDAFVFRRDPLRDHGIAFEDVRLEGRAGALAAWYVPAEGSTAVLLLHGRRRGERKETLRVLPTLHELGMPVLAMSYRNHDASDPSPDGLFHYGASEWEDALVGARALTERGATRIVAFGISMGAAVALEAIRRWPADLPPVAALVLDSPLVDPAAAVRLAAERAGIPFARAAARLVTRAARLRTGVDFADLRQEARAHEIDVPLLLVAGTADTTVPIDAIDRFAARVRAPLEYLRLDGVEHVEGWNAGPAAYDAALRGFLTGAAGVSIVAAAGASAEPSTAGGRAERSTAASADPSTAGGKEA